MSKKANAEAAQNDGPSFSSKAQSGGGITFVRPSQLSATNKTGLVVTGRFEGTVRNEKYDRDDFKLTIIDAASDLLPGLNVDDTMVINSGGNLAKALERENVQQGMLIQIQYNGMSEIKSGPRKGKLSHDFKVLTAD